MIAELPETIPERLFLNVTDENGHALNAELQVRLNSSLTDALEHYSFSDRLIPILFPAAIDAGISDHIVHLVMVLKKGDVPILGMGPLPGNTLGRMCSNYILVPFGENSNLLATALIHEFGHFFGLYHEEWTYMRQDVSCCFGWENRFNSRQVGILDDWNYPGRSYVAHWNYPQPVWANHKWLITLSIIAAAAIVTLALRKKKLSRRPPREA